MPNPNPLLAAYDQLPPEHQAAIAAAIAPKNPMVGNQPPLASIAGAQQRDIGPPPTSGLIPAPNAPQLPKLSGDAPNIKAPRGTLQGDQAERSRLMNTGSGVSQIYHNVTSSEFGQNHPILGKILGGVGQGLATVGDIGLTAASPGLASMVPGTSMHHAALLRGANNAVTADETNAGKEASTAAQNAEIPVRQAQAQEAQTKASNETPIEVTAEHAKAIGLPELEGSMMTPGSIANLAKQHTINSTKENTTNATNTSREKIASGKNDTALDINGQKIQTSKDIAAAHNKTLQLIQGMKDSTSTANTQARVNSTGAKAGNKVPTDVTRRAALASNVVENADAVKELVDAHPEIIGAAGGRFTNIQQMIGSDDPAIQELGVRIHNIALAANGAHGLRSAQAVQETEKQLFNNFKTGPTGVMGAMHGVTDSVGTFLKDEQNFQSTGNRQGTPAATPNAPFGIPKVGTIEDGHEFLGGNPADPKNWKAVTK